MVNFYSYLHNYSRFLRSAGTPQNQREKSKKHEKSHNKRQTVQSLSVPASIPLVIIQQTLFFNRLHLLHPVILPLGDLLVGPIDAMQLLVSGGGEASWGIARMGTHGGMRVARGWRGGRRVEGSRCFVVTAVVWWALYEVSWRSGGGGGGQTRHFRICFCMHLDLTEERASEGVRERESGVLQMY